VKHDSDHGEEVFQDGDKTDTSEGSGETANIPIIISPTEEDSQGKYPRNPVHTCLVSVPENELLLDVDPYVHLGDSQLELNLSIDKKSPSETILNSPKANERDFCPTTRAEQPTALQQVALWLTRTSTQDIRKEFSMNSLRSLVSTGRNTPCKKDPIGSKYISANKFKISRNFSTRSFSEQYKNPPPQQVGQSKIRKCETDLALTQNKHSLGYKDLLQKRNNFHHCSSLHPHQKSSSVLKHISKPSSMMLSRMLSAQHTAPGKLCPGHPSAEFSYRFPGMQPVNRFGSKSSNLQWSKYTSVMSVASSLQTSRTTSQMSLLLDRRCSQINIEEEVQCKICLCDCPVVAMVTLEECDCVFCTECMGQYITFEIMSGSYDISCPDPQCPLQGVLDEHQIENLVEKELLDKHKTFRLNTEVSLDAGRTWCPSTDCQTICHICDGNKNQGVAVTCPTCVKEFCSLCSATWHPGLSCAESGALLVRQGGDRELGDTVPWSDLEENIKRCPMCNVPIERDAGCAQMMCKRCKHVFCWYCLVSLDGDFLLRHFDSGTCRGKLGHSRGSVIFHRAQVIGIFAMFGVLLLAASPLILVAAPAIICCKCRVCSKSVEVAEDRNVLELAAVKN